MSLFIFLKWMRCPEIYIRAPMPSALMLNDPAPEVAAGNADDEEKTAKVGAEVKGASSGI